MKLKKYKLFLMSLVILMVLFLPIYTYANTTAPLLNLGRKWYDTPKDMYFKCYFDTAERNAVLAAMNKWNSVKDPEGNSIVTMHLTTELTPNEVRYGYSFGEWVGKCQLNPELGQEEIEAVTVYIEGDVNWSTTGAADAYDVQTVVMHELGHALGIAHCHEKSEGPGPCWSATCLKNVMNPLTDFGDVNHTFQEYDIASYMMIYYW